MDWIAALLALTRRAGAQLQAENAQLRAENARLRTALETLVMAQFARELDEL